MGLLGLWVARKCRKKRKERIEREACGLVGLGLLGLVKNRKEKEKIESALGSGLELLGCEEIQKRKREEVVQA